MFPKLIKETQYLATNKRMARAYQDDKGNIYSITDLAKIAEVRYPSMRQRLQEWGFTNPKIFKKPKVPYIRDMQKYLGKTFPKLVAETSIKQEKKKKVKAYLDNNRIKYTVLDLANIADTSASTMRSRIRKFGYGSPKIFIGDREPQTEVNVYVDIIEGDLVGKYTGTYTDAETRAKLNKIPSPGTFERENYAI